MIPSIVRTGMMNLRRDRSAMLLTFVLPIVFFSIFAAVFGGRRDGMPKTKVAVVDNDHSRASERLIAALRREGALRVVTAPDAKNAKPYTNESALSAVQNGDLPAALIIPQGFGANPFAFGPAEDSAATKVRILHDSSDPVAGQIVAGMLQKSAMTAMPDVMAETGMKYLDRYSGGLTPQQRTLFEKDLAELKQREAQRDAGQKAEEQNGAAQADSKAASVDGEQRGLIAFEVKDVVGANKANPTIAFYAAGIGIMFVLFSMSGAAGTLLDEAESGTMDRVLSTRVTMGWLLAGKLAYLALIAFAQLCVMFLWGALAFKVELFSHLPGFFVMSVTTAIAASALGLLLASLCRTRAQLGAVSTLIILVMSALGGSMFPRFLMPEVMQKIGLITFNAWALDGFTKVFWRDAPLYELWPQLLVLIVSAAVFFTLARQMARKKWEFS